MALGGTVPIRGGTGWFLVELGLYGDEVVDIMVPIQKKAVLVGTWWYWVRTGSTGWFLVVLGHYMVQEMN